MGSSLCSASQPKLAEYKYAVSENIAFSNPSMLMDSLCNSGIWKRNTSKVYQFKNYRNLVILMRYIVENREMEFVNSNEWPVGFRRQSNCWLQSSGALHERNSTLCFLSRYNLTQKVIVQSIQHLEQQEYSVWWKKYQREIACNDHWRSIAHSRKVSGFACSYKFVELNSLGEVEFNKYLIYGIKTKELDIQSSL